MLDADLANRLMGMVGFRNIAVHEHQFTQTVLKQQ